MKIGPHKAIQFLLGILSLVILLHIFILLKIIPYTIAWGGRLQNDEQMYTFETISIIINLFLISIILMKGRYIQFHFKEKVVNFLLWIFFMLFIINTVGNLFAQTNFEKLFAIFTLILAILIWIILRSGNALEYNKSN